MGASRPDHDKSAGQKFKRRRFVWIAVTIAALSFFAYVSRPGHEPFQRLRKYRPNVFVYDEGYGGRTYSLEFSQPAEVIAAELRITLPAGWRKRGPSSAVTYGITPEQADEARFSAYREPSGGATCGILAVHFGPVWKSKGWIKRIAARMQP